MTFNKRKLLVSGKPINSEQSKLYMKERKAGRTQKTASAKSRISERSGRRIDKKELPPSISKTRLLRTRQDPFAKVWESEIVPLLSNEVDLTPTTLFEELQNKYPSDYPDNKLRTFQRRVREWIALHGPGQEVMFRQHQIAWRMGLSDFTQLKRVEINISGQLFKHLLYHFRLAFSGCCSVMVVHGGVNPLVHLPRVSKTHFNALEVVLENIEAIACQQPFVI